VARGDLEVLQRRVDAADLDHVDDEVGTVEGLATVGVRLDGGRRPELAAHLTRGALGDAEPLGVDVVQHEAGVGELRVAQDVGDELAGEDDAPGADERDADHVDDPRRRRAHCARIRSDFADNTHFE